MYLDKQKGMTMFDYYLIPAVSAVLFIFTAISAFAGIKHPRFQCAGMRPTRIFIQGVVAGRLYLLMSWSFLVGIVLLGFFSGEYRNGLDAILATILTSGGIALALGAFMHRLAWLIIFVLEDKLESSHNRESEVQ